MNICNLNILVKKKGVEQTQVLGFMSCVTLESYRARNDDADGVYFSTGKVLVKGADKINICDYPEECDKSKFIITHQRFTTSGLEIEYAQPFKCDEEEFVLEHNGVFNGFKGDVGSDTYGYFYDHFLTTFKKLKGSREKRIISSIKSTLKDCLGSYSIALYDVKKKNMYYFKNTSKNIYFFKSDDDKMLYITTREKNKDYLYFFNRDFSEMTIGSNKIYRVSVGKKIEVKKVGRIPESPLQRRKKIITCNYSKNGGYNSDYRYRRVIPLKSYKKNKMEDIFEANEELSRDNNEKLGFMFNNHFSSYGRNSNGSSLEDSLLDELLESGYTLRDVGFNDNNDCGFCETCYMEAHFTNDDGKPKCSACVELYQDMINEEFDIADSYLTNWREDGFN